MTVFYAKYPVTGSGTGSGVTTYANLAAFPVSATDGDLAIALDTHILYEWTGAAWEVLADPATSSGFPFQEVPTGLINNSNQSFELSIAPNNSASLSLYLDGLILDNSQYSLSGTTITLIGVVPNFGQELYATYTVLAGGGSGIVTGIADTSSIDLTLSLGVLTADLKQPFLIDVGSTRGAPLNITAAGGIPFTSTKLQNLLFVQGNGGAVTITANPKIAAGTVIGQKLDLIFVDDTNTLTITDGNGVNQNGAIVGNSNSSISYIWEGSNWFELSRRS